MNSWPNFLAQFDLSRDLLDQTTKGPGMSGTLDSLIILGFILLLALALFSWAYFIRRRPTEHDGAHVLVRQKRKPRRSKRAAPPNSNSNSNSHSRDPAQSSESGDSSETVRGARVKRRKRRRKESHFMRRNPTLEETGGLPPLRQEEDSPGPSPAPSSSP